MKKFPLLAALVISQICLTPANAASKGGRPTFVPTITAVGANSITVKTGQRGGLKTAGQDPSNVETYTVTPNTAIEVNGLDGTITDLASGMTVNVTAGIDRSVASRIVARSAGPAVQKPTPVKFKGKKPKGGITYKQAFNPIKDNVVMAVTANTITIAAPGAKASAYRIIPSTVIMVNDAPGTLSQITVGMNARVAASGQNIAGRIDAGDANPEVNPPKKK